MTTAKTICFALSSAALFIHCAAIWCLFQTHDTNGIALGLGLAIDLIVTVAIAVKAISLPGFPFRQATNEERESILTEFWGSAPKRIFSKAVKFGFRLAAGLYMTFGHIDLVPLGVAMTVSVAYSLFRQWANAFSAGKRFANHIGLTGEDL